MRSSALTTATANPVSDTCQSRSEVFPASIARRHYQWPYNSATEPKCEP
jgi:hypothetical protein